MTGCSEHHNTRSTECGTLTMFVVTVVRSRDEVFDTDFAPVGLPSQPANVSVPDSQVIGECKE